MTSRNNIPHRCQTNHQKGAALIIGLVLLISLTIIGISVLSTTSLEHRMAGNMADQNLAFNAAEAVGRAITAQAANLNGPMSGVCARINVQPGCVKEIDALPDNWWDTATPVWWSANAISAANFMPAINGVGTQPQIVIEIIPYTDPVKGVKYDSTKIEYVRLTSRGIGASNNTEVVIQQTIMKY